MKSNRIAVAFLAGAAVLAPSLHGQVSKPSPYSGVSQPPPDDTITTDAAAPSVAPAPAPAARLVTRPATPASAPAPEPSASELQLKCNPDDRMIGDPLPCETPIAGTTGPRAAAADFDEPARPGELPEGTILHITLDQELSSRESHLGADFSGRIATDVSSSGKVVIPQGSEVVGKIVRVTEGRRFGGPATIRLRPDVVVLPDGSRYVLRAQVINTNGKSRVGSEGTLKPESHLKTNAIKEGAGIGGGAVAGALIAGPTGAVVGSIIGAGVMTTNILVQQPSAVKLPKDSQLTLSLTQPMSITPDQASNRPLN